MKPILKLLESGDFFLFFENLDDMIPDECCGHNMMQTAPEVGERITEKSCHSSEAFSGKAGIKSADDLMGAYDREREFLFGCEFLMKLFEIRFFVSAEMDDGRTNSLIFGKDSFGCAMERLPDDFFGNGLLHFLEFYACYPRKLFWHMGAFPDFYQMGFHVFGEHFMIEWDCCLRFDPPDFSQMADLGIAVGGLAVDGQHG